MDHIRFTLLSLLVVVGLGSAAVQGQANTSAQTNNAALREKAFEVIDSVANQLGTLQSPENRARLGSNIAEALWPRDEKRARALFISIEEDINTGLRNAEGDEQIRMQTRLVFLQLRINTVERIAKHDSELALSFLKATEISDEAPRSRYAYAERMLLLNLAKQVALRNPDLALKLGRESLQTGFPNELLALLKKLNTKHREQATALYGDIVIKLKDADLSTESEAFYFSLSLARLLKPPAIDEASYRQLISLFVARALAHGCGDKKAGTEDEDYFCRQIGSLVPQMEKIDPRAARLKQWVSEEQESESEWSPEAYEELAEVSENGTVDELLALATKYPYLREEVYRRAINKAESSGDAERATKIATEFDGDPETKQAMLKSIENNRVWASMNEEKMAQVQRTLNTLPGTMQRIFFLMGVAGQVGAYDRKASLKFLDQANQLVQRMKPGTDQTEVQMLLSIMYCSEKSDRGLAIMESLIPKLNELIAATAKLDGYDHHNLRDGEWNMSSEGSIGSFLTALSQNAAYFAWCDFERAVNLSAQFERPEIRLMAQLKLAQGVLAGQPPRIRPPMPSTFIE